MNKKIYQDQIVRPSPIGEAVDNKLCYISKKAENQFALSMFILSLIFWLIILNIFEIKNFYFRYIWNASYDKQDFENASKYFLNSDDLYWNYDYANSLYKQKNYEEALKEYLSILNEEKSKTNFKISHNVWNTYYRLWEINKKDRLQLWERSVKYYQKALDIRYDEETKQNLEFVLKKLEEEKNKNNQNEDNKNNENQNWDNSEQNKNNNEENNEQSWSWSEDKNSENWENNKNQDWNKWEKDENQQWSEQNNSWDEKNTSENKNSSWKSVSDSKQNSLSESEQAEIQKYEQYLKDAQKQNSDYFNKVYNQNNNNDIFNSFFNDDIFNDPFFNNDLLNQDNNEKDW